MFSRERLVRTVTTLGVLGSLTGCLVDQKVATPAAIAGRLAGGNPVVEPAPANVSLVEPSQVLALPPTPTPLPEPTRSPVLPEDREEQRELKHFQREAEFLSPAALVELATNPRAPIVSRARFFTSTCFGPNPLEKEDSLKSLDW